MMELLEMGISEETVKEMIERVPVINDMNPNEIHAKVYLLEKIGCDKYEIVNIVSSNPDYFDRTNKDIIDILKKLVSLGFKSLDMLLDSNPSILNLDSFEIDNYINKRVENGESLEDIVDDLDSNPYLFNEM